MNANNMSVIDTLNNMYNHNIRLIEDLYCSNNEIRNAIVNLGNNREYHNNVRQNNTNNSNNSNNNVRQNNNNSNNHRQRRRRSNSNNFARQNNNIQRIYRTLGDDVNVISQLVDEIIYIAPNSNPNNRSNSSTTNEHTSFIRNFFDPVTVSPSQTQVELATRNVRYGDIIRPLNTSCPISLENFTDDDIVTVIRHCNHIFHTRGINSWFRSNCKCPICRYDIRSYNYHTTDTSNNGIVVERPNINDETTYDPMTLDRFLNQGSFDARNLLSFIIDNSNNIVDSISDANSHTLSFNFTNP